MAAALLPLLLATAAAASAAAAPGADGPAAPLPDLAALIECRLGVQDFARLAPLGEDPLAAVAHGWQPLPQTNLFMAEYRLARPVTVFGHATDHIAMAGGSIVALLKGVDARALARGLALEEGVDTPDKLMYGRELVSRDVTDAATGEALIESVILGVSTVKSHPGITLAGCTYSLDIPEEAPAAPSQSSQPAEQTVASP